MLSKILLMPALSLLIVSTAVAELRVLPPQSAFDASHSYFISLLQQVLAVTANDYPEETLSYAPRMEQGRALLELEKGRIIDISWAGTSQQREQRLTAVRIPLLKGLLGFRQAIIHIDNQKLFDELRSKGDMAQLSACQGAHWPDSDILEAGGLKVLRSPVYESMFRQVESKRCHYFPRGVHEIAVEIASRAEAYPQLMHYQGLLLYYPFPMYFFVSPNRPKLKQRIELGLKRLIERGDFDHHLRSHSTTKHLFPLTRWINVPTFVLDNPLLPYATNVTDPVYWIQPHQ